MGKPKATREYRPYVIVMTCLVSGKPLYLREESWAGQHMTYRRTEAAHFTLDEARRKSKFNARYRVELSTPKATEGPADV